MDFPEVDPSGEIICLRSGSSYERLLQSVAPGNALLIVPAPSVDAWWDSGALEWVLKPPRPVGLQEWDPVSKAWHDPRTADEIQADALAALRSRRNECLAESDLLAVRALEGLLPEPLRSYRQALRDLPASVDDPSGPIEWPQKPLMP
ncbi:phage tail assembly chaperone [Sphaerotilus sp.]|uniref:phage tail assembly chaperone n=1 Tax=Sphaerotilus sp. TaxID=2093942 RepID=UPI0038F743E0